MTRESRAVHVVWAGIARADDVEQSWRLGATQRVLLSVEDLGYQRGAAVYVALALAAVRAPWDRSGLRAGPAISVQPSAFANAFRAALAERDPAVEVLVRARGGRRLADRGRDTAARPAGLGCCVGEPLSGTR